MEGGRAMGNGVNSDVGEDGKGSVSSTLCRMGVLGVSGGIFV